MRLKIRGGTARHDQTSLCNTCRHATVVRGIRLGDEIVECAALAYHNNRVTFPVTFCTGFVERQHPTIREMEDIAWVLRTDAKRQRVGFVHAKELRPKERYVISDE